MRSASIQSSASSACVGAVQGVAARYAELARYRSRPAAEESLGLKNFTLATVAAAGAISYVKGPERNFPERCFFLLREDVNEDQGCV